MKKIYALLILAAFTLQNKEVNAQIVINEIMYNPPETGTDSTEFIELFNAGSATVDLTGYMFTSGVVFTFPSASINAGEYAVVAVSASAILNTFGVTAYEWTSGGLSNSGETITLTDASSTIVDEVTYDDSTPWPTTPDGDGYSLELSDATSDNNDGNNWFASYTATGANAGGVEYFCTPGSANLLLTAPLVNNAWAVDASTVNVAYTEAVNTTGEDVANYTGLGTVSSAVRNTTQDTVTLTLGTPLTANVAYTLLVSNVENLASTVIADTTFEITHAVSNGTPGADIVITEINYNNPSTDTLEYIELYNNGTTTANLEDYEFSQGITFTFPNVTLNAGEYLVVAIDADAVDGFYGISSLEWTSGSLSNSGENVVLIDNLGATIDSVDYSDSAPWFTAADGDGPSLVLCDPSLDNADATNWSLATANVGMLDGLDVFGHPGAGCPVVTVPTIAFALATEMVQEDAGTVMVELTITDPNASAASVDVVLGTSTATNGADFTFTDPTTVTFAAGATTSQMVSITITDDAVAESLEEMVLMIQNPVNAQVGVTAQYELTIADNDGVVTDSLFINEFLASNAADTTDENAEHDDWIEIYNPNSTAVDIAGYFITDDVTDPTKYEIPSGSAATIIPANGFILIWADNEEAQGELHTNFALSAGGEFIGLYDNNNNVLDTITFGSQTTDESYGRSVDGGSPWVTFMNTTPNASNEETTIGIEDATLTESLIAYPNPTNGSFIHFNKVVSVTIYNQLGAICTQGTNVNQLDIANLSNGLYILVTDANETLKFEVHR